MMGKKKLFLFLVLILLMSIAVPVIGAFDSEAKRQQPQVENGVLDLTDWDFITDGSVYLNGNWEFYWKQLLTDASALQTVGKPAALVQVPGVWNSYEIDGRYLPGSGFATYRLTIKLPEQHGSLAIKILSMSTAYRLIANGEVVAANGIVAEDAQESQGQLRPQAVTLPAANGEYELLVQVSNYLYDRGGIWYSLLLGDEDSIDRKRAIGIGQDLFLSGCLFVLGLYHVAIYLLRRLNKSDLYFGIGSLIVSLRAVFTGEIFVVNLFPDLDIQLSVFIEYLTYYWGMFIFSLVIKEFYPQEAPKLFIKIHFGLTILFTAIAVFFPMKIYTATINGYHLVVLLSCVYAIGVVIRAAIHRRVGAWIHIAIISMFILAVIHDMLYNAAVIHLIPSQMVPFSILLFVFSQAFISALRYSQAYKTIQEMSDQLLSLDRMKDEFLAKTSHELKTPLHGILNISQLMLEEAADTLNVDQQKKLGIVVSTTRRLTHLINDILDISRLKHMNTELHRKSISLSATIQASIDIFRYFIEDKPIRLISQLAEPLPNAWADENRLMQILSNLIGNAIKFTERGTILVSAYWNREELVISVSDTGIGIPMDKLESIFESFKQVDAANGMEHEGIGLGLHISKTLVELHGGRIWAESKLGAGSTFYFTLPVHQAEKSVHEESRQREKVSHPIVHQESVPMMTSSRTDADRFTILAVDDEMTNLFVLKNALADRRVHLLTASSGQEALQLLAQKQQPIDLVILDVMMPGMSGLEVCRSIRENDSITELPVLLVTAQNRPMDIELGFEAGANDYLTKPFELTELRARVGTLLELKGSVNRLMKAQMDFLQAQIKPHFLYNTINTIVYFCRYDGAKAAELLIQLSNYLRGSFDLQSQDVFVPLERELELVQSYLAIEQARYGDKLKVVYNIAAVKSHQVPSLILQPIVENAVRHGLAQKRAGGTVTIDVWEEDTNLYIRVADDGVGLSAERLQAIEKRRAERVGVGIGNINRRLSGYYGSSLKIDSEVNKGTSVTIQIPMEVEAKIL
ncbi:ATP-binding protein [Paenibacillaceae bacterium WGS1546]|uniref:hybrid sensor histidine kinase/response regulator n=1 Tax=Cohnella sp. WGS1546 TaxID=3366810 RepID=UPI00372D055E